MILITKEIVDKEEKFIYNLLKEHNDYPDSLFISHMWLINSPQKRAIYNLMYGAYLCFKSDINILDIGGGYNSLTKILIKNTGRYTLIDPLFGDKYKITKYFPVINIEGDNWYTHVPKEYDIVLANDLFPNTDQRLRLFLEKYIKVSHRIVLSLTFHNTPKFYEVERRDRDESMCMLAYTGEDIKNILRKYIANIINPDFSILDSKETVFHNGRQVCIVEIEGEI